MLVPAKLNVPIKFTSPERLKLTIQNYRLENKVLKAEIDDMKREILTKSKPIDDELSKDFISIMSNVDKDEIPPFMIFFLGGTAELFVFFHEWRSLPSHDHTLLS